MLDTIPKFTPGTRVYILALDETKTVLYAQPYKGAEWGYVLVDEQGVEDDGWREDELERR